MYGADVGVGDCVRVHFGDGAVYGVDDPGVHTHGRVRQVRFLQKRHFGHCPLLHLHRTGMVLEEETSFSLIEECNGEVCMDVGV